MNCRFFLKQFHFLFLYLLIFPLNGCQSEAKQDSSLISVFSGNAMTIDYKIIIGHPLTPIEEERIKELILTTFKEVDAIYNKYNPESEISLINRMPAEEKRALSAELEDLFELSQQMYDLSGGRFDPTVEPLHRLWQEKLATGEVPLAEEIEELIPVVGWNKIHLKNGYVSKDHGLTSLDFGGIAKGLCVDMLAERIQDAGFPNVFVEWGGEIRALGEHPDGRDWKIFITRLGDTNPEHAIAHLSLKNQAIATSGDYLQQWSVFKPSLDDPDVSEKITYFHILDPRSHSLLISKKGKITSASVLSTSCAFADGLATVAMMFDTIEEANRWAEQVRQQFPDTQFWLIARDE